MIAFFQANAGPAIVLAIFTGSILASSLFDRFADEARGVSLKPLRWFAGFMLLILLPQLQCASAELHKAPLTALRFAADGRSFASTDHSGVAIVWNSESCQETSTLDSAGGGSFAAISADLTRTASTDAGFPEVHVANLVDRSTKKLEISNSDFLLAIDSHPRGEFLGLGTRDAAILFWDPNTSKIRQTLRGHRADVTSVVFDQSGQKLASGSINGEVILWDLNRARPMETIRLLPQPSVASVFFSTDGERIVAANRDGQMHTWNLTNGKSTPIKLSWSAMPTDIAVSPNGDLVAARIGESILIRLAKDGAIRDEILISPSAETPLLFSPDGRYLAFSDSGGAFLRSIEQRKTTRAGAATKNNVALSFAPAEPKLVFATSERVMSFFDWQTARTSDLPVPGHTSYIRSIALSPDGKILATGGGMYDGNIVLWSVDSGRLLRIIQPNDPTDVVRMFFSPDSQTLATVTAFSNLLRLWDVASGRLLSASTRFDESLNAVTAAYSPKGNLLATVQKGAIVVHDLVPANWIESVCRTVNRNLTMDDWKDYIGSASYQAPCTQLPIPK